MTTTTRKARVYKTPYALLKNGRIGDQLTDHTPTARFLETITDITITEGHRLVTTEIRSVFRSPMERYNLKIERITHQPEGWHRETLHESISTFPETTAYLNRLYAGLLAR